ncbi:MAG: cysteine--tRNA ligase [Bacteroidales bacterium]|nr:cysteine--tRNA ligase [Bacteroidales bacterium]MCF8403516.1 cysteine--tRNA ligase [Bacteroidales bacterium]
MENKLSIYNTLSRKKELFEPINPPFVGMYVCGPTVYGDAHLGHARPAINFDLVFRYLTHLGYKVRYVRNITDVGHLEGDADAGEDKIGKKARLDNIEPMEVVQYFTNQYHRLMDKLNVLRPSIEPHASGHIIEQIDMIQKLLAKGYAYEKNGSVYFDIEAYNKKYDYGILSGRKVEELLAFTRELDGQEEKKSSADFALWKKATPEHLMHWPSPWSEGYPGWHLECSVMGTKYLGEEFDIHGGGLDLQFPHHECEIAQSMATNDKAPVKYWLHNNMITLNGQKMGKSLGNAVSLDDFFTGNHPLLNQAYSPATIRFFMMQAHYRSPLDFSNEALQAAEKGFKKLMAALKSLKSLASGQSSTSEIKELKAKCYEAMNDDFNTPILISHLFEGVRIINSVKDKKESLSADDLSMLKELMNDFVFDILGLKDEAGNENQELINGLMDTILNIRQNARANKDWPTSDLIRDNLQKYNIKVKDTKDGSEWSIE